METANYVGSLYLSDSYSNFTNNEDYQRVGSSVLYDNFTFEFDAKPTVTTPIYSLKEYAGNGNNFILYDSYTTDSNTAGIGLAIGTNGAVAIAHGPNYYYVLLTYKGNLSEKHRYRFTLKNNVPYLYVDGSLVATGIEPFSPISILKTNSFILAGSYGTYTGYANNFVLYNTAR